MPLQLPENLAEIAADKKLFGTFMAEQCALIGAVAAAVVVEGDTQNRTRALDELPDVVMVGVTAGFNAYLQAYDAIHKGDKDAGL
jgi:hypothetical protein